MLAENPKIAHRCARHADGDGGLGDGGRDLLNTGLYNLIEEQADHDHGSETQDHDEDDDDEEDFFQGFHRFKDLDTLGVVSLQSFQAASRSRTQSDSS